MDGCDLHYYLPKCLILGWLILFFFSFACGCDNCNPRKWITQLSLCYTCMFSHTFYLVALGICADIAGSKHEYWSSFAPLPFELVISAGQKAKEESGRKI